VKKLLLLTAVIVIGIVGILILWKSDVLKGTALLTSLERLFQTSSAISETNTNTSDTTYIEELETRVLEDPTNAEEDALNLKQTGWIPAWGYVSGFSSLSSNSEYFDSISPVFYELNSDGSVKKYDDHIQELVSYSHANGIQIIPSIAGFSGDDLHLILEDDGMLASHVAYLITEIDTYGFDGIDIDYEEIYQKDHPEFLYFLDLLHQELQTRGKILSIAVMPNWTYASVHVSSKQTRRAQEWHELGLRADEFRIMTYNVTNFNSTYPGPVAPLDWQEANLRFARATVDNTKTYLGINQYGYAGWGGNPTYTEPYLTVFNNPVSENGLAEAFTYTQVKSREAGSIERFLDPYSLEKVMKYSYQGGTYMLYYPDHETHAYRLDLAKKYNIAGVAHWRLGNEDPFIYQLVANY